MAIPKIANLDQLLGDYLGSEKIVTDLEINRLTSTGENYGSQMLALKIHLKNQKESEILEAVAKIPPPGEYIRRMFNIPITFRNEIDFYQTIVLELEAFLEEKNLKGYLDCFPKLLGARISLDSQKNEVDDDATIILENLNVEGYKMLNRTIGFDYATSKVVMKSLAKYHAVPLGLKLLKPELFQKKIRTLFQPYKIFPMDNAAFELLVERTRKMFERFESCKEYVQRAVDAFRSSYLEVKNEPKLVREPFATIIHTDSWVNNFMVQFQDGKPTNCKIVDFQLDEYGSPLRDVIFFIFTSVQIDVIREHCDDLMGLYHESLIGDLKKFGCDTTAFSMEALKEEARLAVQEYEFFHCVIMLQPIFATKEVIKELDEYTDEDMTKEFPLPPKHLERAEFIVLEFVKRGWI